MDHGTRPSFPTASVLIAGVPEQNPLRRHRQNAANGTPLLPLYFRPPKTPSFKLTPPLQQGIGWFMRRLISLATVTLTITQYTSSDDNNTHIDIHQVASPGNISSQENRILDWTYRDHSDKVFGEVKGKSRWAKLKEVEDHEFLKEGYDDLEGEHVQG
ncbi:MAG: hypothetical protein Q9212_003545, partial [Teloschistes hypoglaucus]